MHRILTIARLTWKSAFRYRLFWVMAALLVASVVALPLVLEDDGTAAGMTQILLTYTLSAITFLLGFATLWLSCGTLARDVEECQIQMVTVKPISRWQIWIGKWLGILALNALLLALSGFAVFMLLQWRARRLAPAQQAIIHNEIFVARAATHEKIPDLEPEVRRLAAEWRKSHPQVAGLSADDARQLNSQLFAEARSEYESVPPLAVKVWPIDLSGLPARMRDEPLQLRVKIHSADPNPAATYPTAWRIGPVNSPDAEIIPENLPPDSFQEFAVPNLPDASGRLVVAVHNESDTTLIFPLEDGCELLYRENSFAVNFARGLAVILCWLALLSAIGLASASFLSFPVAAFCSLAVLLIGLSAGTLGAVQEQKSIFAFTGEPPGLAKQLVDKVSVPLLGAVLKVVNLVQSFSPIESLSAGRSITWGQLGRAVAQIVLLMGGLFCVAGLLLFHRRELAAVQVNS